MGSKKRTIGILIVVIVVLLGFAGSLLMYRNRLSSEKANNDLIQENIMKNYFYVTEEENIVYDSVKHIKYVNNELEIVVESGTDINDIHELAKKYNAEIVGEIEILNTYQFKFNENFMMNQLEEIITDIKKSSFVQDVNINYVWNNVYNTYEINKGDIWKNETWNEEIPDGKNWGLEAIHCISAWDLLNKKSINPIRIGIIDNVFDENHEDLGFAKTYYNCSHSEILKYVSENDSYEHGTNVAGVMAANSRLDSHGSDIGICGVYPFGYGNVYGISFIGASKTNIAIESYLVTLIVENNVKVINISCLGDVNLTFRASHLNEDSAKNEFKKSSLPIEKKLIELINLKYDFLICTAAGNESYTWFKENKNGEYEEIRDTLDVFGATKTNIIDAEYGPLFATIDNEELRKRIIVVGAIEQEKNYMQICSYSNGGNRVDIYAPGEKITTTQVDNKYHYYFSGTSAATPFVSGTAAMVWSVNNNLTGEEVKEILCNTAKCPENSGSEYFKMVNAKLAVEEAIRRTDTIVVPIEDETQLTEPVEIQELNYTWHLAPTIEAEDIIVSDIEKYAIFVPTANPFDEYSIVKQNGKYRFIKYDGTYISDMQYDEWHFSTPNAVTCSSENNESVTVLGKENNIEISYGSHDAGWGSQGFYINNKTKDIYYIEYGSYYKYSKNNNVVVQSADISLISNEKNQLGVAYDIQLNNIGKYGIANNSGLFVDCVYNDACMNIGDDIIALEKDGKWGYFNKDGTQIIDFICEPFESKILDVMWLHNHDDKSIHHPFLSSCGYIPIKIDGKCGYYDTKGNEVIPCGTFEEVRPVHNGLAWVKKDGKWGVIKLNNTEKSETDYQKQYYTFIENELIPKYGLANVDTNISFSNSSGIVSAIIDDFSNTGSMDLLVVRLENSADSIDIVCAWYNWDGNSVVPIDEITVESNYGITSNIDVSFNQGYLCFNADRIWLNSNNSESSIWIYSFNNSKLNPVRNYEIHRFHGYIDEITETIRKEINIKSQDYKLNLNDVKTFHDDLKSLEIEFNNDEVDCQLINGNNLLNYALSVRESLSENCRFIISDYTDLRSHIIVTPQKITNGQYDYKDIHFKGTVNTEKDPLNVRKSPSANAEIIGKLEKGSTVTIYAESGDWYEIEYNGGVGYVSKKYIKSKDNNSDTQTSSISDNEILKAVNKYLEENQSNLGVWLSDSTPYCPAGHMYSNDTNWSCPINTDWDSYSSNEMVGAYPHFAYVDKNTLKCTITANYETVMEFDLSNYLN